MRTHPLMYSSVMTMALSSGTAHRSVGRRLATSWMPSVPGESSYTKAKSMTTCSTLTSRRVCHPLSSRTMPAVRVMHSTCGVHADMLLENPYVAAQRFLNAHELPMTYLDEVVKFIEKNTGGVSLGGGAQYSDPFTGMNLCVLYEGHAHHVTGASRYQPAQAAGGNRGQDFMDPFTGKWITDLSRV